MVGDPWSTELKLEIDRETYIVAETGNGSKDLPCRETKQYFRRHCHVNDLQ